MSNKENSPAKENSMDNINITAKNPTASIDTPNAWDCDIDIAGDLELNGEVTLVPDYEVNGGHPVAWGDVGCWLSGELLAAIEDREDFEELLEAIEDAAADAIEDAGVEPSGEVA